MVDPKKGAKAIRHSYARQGWDNGGLVGAMLNAAEAERDMWKNSHPAEALRWYTEWKRAEARLAAALALCDAQRPELMPWAQVRAAATETPEVSR